MSQGDGAGSQGAPPAPAPWDAPGVLAALAPRRRAADHARAGKAPEALDLRLLAPALSAWAAAFWAVGLHGSSSWRTAVGAALAGLGACAVLLPRVVGFRPPRHRADPRPGAQDQRPASIGSPAAGLLLCAAAATSVLAVSSAQLWARGQDPLVAAVGRGEAVVLIATIGEQPRVLATPRATTVLTILDVESVDGAPSRSTALVLGGDQWARLEMGSRVRVRTTPRAADPGARHTALIGRSASVRLLSAPSGTLGAVTALRQGLSRAAGAPDHASAWPPGSSALLPGVALGDDHALPATVRQDMRTVSMTHLTAVSGQHVAIVLGLVLAALGVVPRRWRALAGALVLAGLVVVVRPSGSVLRSATMGCVMLAGVVAGRRAAALPSLGTGVLLLVLADPWQARDYGFALSVAATAGILLGHRPAAAVLSRRLPRWLATTVALPLVAQAACTPILILLQPSVGVWSVPANILAAPIVPLVTICGILAALVAPLWPAAAAAIAWPAVAGCAWLVVVAGFFAHLPGASMAWPAGPPGAATAAVIEAAALCLAHCGARRRIRHLLAEALAGAAGRLSRGRLGPWHPPAPRAPGAHAAPRPVPPGIRPSSPRWFSSALVRRSWPTGLWPASWPRPRPRTRRRRSLGSRPPPMRPTSSTPWSLPPCSASRGSSSSQPLSR